jgi:putative ATP-dependent endonuclease of OLD family
MISEVRVQNYRSLKDVVVPIGPLTALVGPNGAGKTSVLRAIDLVLGSRWPTLGSVAIPEDFTGFDTRLDLCVEVRFSPQLIHTDALKKDNAIAGFKVNCRPYKRATKSAEVGDLHMEFIPINEKGEAPMVAVGRLPGGAPKFQPLTVGTELRERGGILFIDHRRSLIQHLPSSRGSILGRLMAPVRQEFEREADAGGRSEFERRYEAAMDALRTAKLREVESTIADTAKSMIGFLGSKTVSDVEISFGFADPANPFTSLRLEYREGGLTVPGQELGLGVQSAMVVGIFEAFRRLKLGAGTIVIEEPEMYLHPQAQRYFYRLLREMADRGEAQVIYSTHSPIFADATRYEAIRLVRRPFGDYSRVTSASLEDQEFLRGRREAQKLATGLSVGRSELFFARKVLLVEGPGDQLGVRATAEKMGFDLDAENLAVVECGSKFAIPFFARICRAFAVDCVILHDEDIHPEEGDEESTAQIRKDNTRHRKVNSEIVGLVNDPGQCFVMKPSLEGELGIGRRADDKPMRIAEALNSLALDQVPLALRGAVTALTEAD